MIPSTRKRRKYAAGCASALGSTSKLARKSKETAAEIAPAAADATYFTIFAAAAFAMVRERASHKLIDLTLVNK